MLLDKIALKKFVELCSHKLLHPIVLCSMTALTMLLRGMGLHSHLEPFLAFMTHVFWVVGYGLVAVWLIGKTLGGSNTWKKQEN